MVTNGSTTVISDSAKLNVTEKVVVTQQPTAYSCGDGEKAVYSCNGVNDWEHESAYFKRN